MQLTFLQTIAGVVLLSVIVRTKEVKLECHFDRIECMKDNEYFEQGTMRVQKFNSTTFVLHGTFKVKMDLGNYYEFTLDLARAPYGQNNYAYYPLKIQRTKVCTFLQGQYHELIEPFVRNHTNLPGPTERDLCPLPKSDYYFQHYVLPCDAFPQVIPDGNWRINIIIYMVGSSDAVVMCSLYCRMSHISYN